MPPETEPTLPSYEQIQQQRANEAMRHSRIDTRTACLLLLSVLAVFYTLYFASAIILPMILALVVNLLLSTPLRFLHMRLRLPKPLAALCLILCVFGMVGAVGTAISVPATGWLERAPDALNTLRDRLAFLRGPFQLLTSASERIHNFMTIANGHGEPSASTATTASGQVIVVASPTATGGLDRFSSSILLGTQAFMGQFFTMILMLFFLLAQGDSLLRRFVEIMPTFADKRRAVQIAYQIERNVSQYLATITIINSLVGLVNMVQCWLLGMPTRCCGEWWRSCSTTSPSSGR